MRNIIINKQQQNRENKNKKQEKQNLPDPLDAAVDLRLLQSKFECVPLSSRLIGWAEVVFVFFVFVIINNNRGIYIYE